MGDSRFFRRDEFGEARVGIATGLLVLLAQVVPRQAQALARFVRVDLDVVAGGVRGPQAVHAARGEPAALDDALEHRLAFFQYVARGLAVDFIRKDVRILSGEIPRLEERRPVDIGYELLERIVLERNHAEL